MSRATPSTTLTSESRSSGADEESTAIPGVVVSLGSVKTEKTSGKKKTWILIALVIVAGLAIGLGYSFGIKSTPLASSTEVDAKVDADADAEAEVDVDVDVDVETKNLSWNQIGDAINGNETREFFGAGVATNRNGTIISVMSNFQKHVFKEVDGFWKELNVMCGFCKDTYGESFDPDSIDAESESGWGTQMSANGDIVTYGTAYSNFGVAYIRKYNYTTGKYGKLGEPIHGEETTDEFGTSISMSEDGSILGVAALQGDYISFYEQGDSNEWQATGRIDDINLDFFRSQYFAISGDGSRAAAGVPLDGVKMFERKSSGIWEGIGTIITSNATEKFGMAVSLSFTGDRVLVSDPRMKNETGIPTGSIQVFSQDPESNEWKQLGNTMFGNGATDFFGHSCSMSSDGNLVTAAAVGDQGFFLLGYVKSFRFEAGSWNQVGDLLQGVHIADWFGYSLQLSFDGTRLVVGSMLYSGEEANSFKGQVRIFELKSPK